MADHNGAMQGNGATQGTSDSSGGKGSRQVKGSRLVLKQFHALLVKRFHHAIRSQKDFVAQVSPDAHHNEAFFIVLVPVRFQSCGRGSSWGSTYSDKHVQSTLLKNY